MIIKGLFFNTFCLQARFEILSSLIALTIRRLDDISDAPSTFVPIRVDDLHSYLDLLSSFDIGDVEIFRIRAHLAVVFFLIFAVPQIHRFIITNPWDFISLIHARHVAPRGVDFLFKIIEEDSHRKFTK